MPQDNEKIKRVIKKVVDNSNNLELAILKDTTDINDKVDTLGDKIAEPKDVNLNIEGATKVIIRGKDGIDGENGKDGEKGEKGDKGDDGYTPIKGVDYFDGKDGKDGKDGIDGLDGKDGKDGKNGIDGSPDTREQIIEKINSGGETKIDFSQIYGFDFPTRTEVQTELARITSMRGGIGQIEAFSSTGKIGSGSALKFIGSGVSSVTSDGHTVTVNITGGAGSSSWGSITGTLSDQTDLQTALDAKKSGVDSVVDASGADYIKLSTALAATPATGLTYYVSDGTYTETSQIKITRSSTKVNLSGGAVIQNNGATLTTLIAPSTTGLSRVEIAGGKLLQTNATAQGVAIDLSDTPNAWVSRMRIEEYGTGIQIIDATSTSFYSSFRDIQMFNVNNGISLGGTQPNFNLWDNVRIRPKAGGAGTGIALVDTRGNNFLHVNVEPATATGITGISLDATTRDNSFFGIWLENNATNLSIASGANNNSFFGGTITGASVADITDAGTNTTMIAVNKSGTKIYRLPKLTDIQGLNLVTFTETASAVNNLNLANSATGNAPVLSATGTDSNIDITFTPKGTGKVNIASVNITGGSVTGITDITVADGGTGASTAAGARANLGNRHVVSFVCTSSGANVIGDATTYYFGFPFDVSFLTTTITNRQISVPIASVLREATIAVVCTVGTSTEKISAYARINDTTDVTLSTNIATDAASSRYEITGLSQAIAAGDDIAIKLVTPTFTGTKPTNVRLLVNLYFE